MDLRLGAEHAVQILPAGRELRLEMLLPLLPAQEVEARLEVHQVPPSGVEGDEVELAFAAAVGLHTDPKISVHEVAVVLVPLRRQPLQVFHVSRRRSQTRWEDRGGAPVSLSRGDIRNHR